MKLLIVHIHPFSATTLLHIYPLSIFNQLDSHSYLSSFFTNYSYDLPYRRIYHQPRRNLISSLYSSVHLLHLYSFCLLSLFIFRLHKRVKVNVIDAVFSRRSLPCICSLVSPGFANNSSIHVFIYSCLATIPFCALGSQLSFVSMHDRPQLSILDF
ncbi:hypothetical protein BJX66DRAFT_123192 [Aspergillus keveii]|uniref:Uncharacterized protein n=1 Tax=Aspergillus keveii TaxID=714993 RepID=A0ABR4GCR1_9EURO